MNCLKVLLWGICFALIASPRRAAGAQQASQPGPDAKVSQLSMDQAGHNPLAVTALVKLVEEAERNNPEILAARRAWQAATQVPTQVSTLPDPELMVQQFAVGSPRPFAGFTNSDFAYIGLGVSQELPYPGKLRLRGEMAHREAASRRLQV
jgi:outer membrane protein TolC